jgi:NADP-dependent 3-hydroxy acid dehydrogenase YdfG
LCSSLRNVRARLQQIPRACQGRSTTGSLEGRVALVTGASRGIGRAIATALAAEGVKLGLASRSGSDLGIDGAVGVACDVRDPAALEAAVAATVDRFGGLDILVVNAGVGAYGPFLDLAPEHIEEMIDVNVKGAIYAVRAALPHLLESDAADFVMIASEAGRRGLPNEAVYCASKFAQVGLTAALDHELRERGVRCTNICPGGVDTEFAMGRGRTPDMPQLGGMMRPEDVAEAVRFVLTRPRTHRILEVAFRPVTEPSWG